MYLPVDRLAHRLGINDPYLYRSLNHWEVAFALNSSSFSVLYAYPYPKRTMNLILNTTRTAHVNVALAARRFGSAADLQESQASFRPRWVSGSDRPGSQDFRLKTVSDLKN